MFFRPSEGHGLSYNPISLLLESYRKVIYGNLDSVENASWGRTLIWTDATPPDLMVLAVIFAIGVVILLIGTIVFKRLEPAFAKIL